MNELEEKRAAADKLRREISVLEEKEQLEKEWPAWKAREGSYWKFRNSYSSPQSAADYWWMYRHVTHVTPDGYMDTLDFQIDKDGRLVVRQYKRTPWIMIKDWIPSTDGEWREAALVAQEIVRKLIF